LSDERESPSCALSSPMTSSLIASRYRILRELGRGGMGVVYVVEHTRTGDQLALKLLHGRAARDPQAIERFKREARASARIKSDHVVKVVDADIAPELENAPFLVMELLDGHDLEKLVTERGRLPPEEVLDYLTQTARALDKSHALGIIHRDLKPENIFLHRREDGSTIVKVLDFGISKIVGTEGGGDMTGAGMTSTGAVMGTPLYMAPEQARGLVSQIAPTTDVWAVGLIALRLLTGEIYWTANSVAELMVHILAEPLYRPTQRWPWLPAGIDDWFARSCAREPAHRFRGVGEQVDALGEALGLRGAAFASTFQAQAPTLAQAPPRPMPMPLAAPAPPPRSAPTMPMPGAATTNHPHALGTTGAATAPRSRAAPILFAVLGTTFLGGLGGAAWVMRERLASHDAPTTLAPAVMAAGATSSAPPLAASPLPPVVALAASSVAVAAPPPDAAANASARPTVRPLPWKPPPQAGAPAATPHPTTFAPVSP
jgi:predicted Ser/Thr protein kinase